LKAVSAKSDEVAKSSDSKSEDTNLRGFLWYWTAIGSKCTFRWIKICISFFSW
jgi:hypothetical protein